MFCEVCLNQGSDNFFRLKDYANEDYQGFRLLLFEGGHIYGHVKGVAAPMALRGGL